MDLADKIDDLICTFDGLQTTFDTIAMYAFGVFVFVLLVLVIGYHLYGKYRPAVPVEKEPKEAPKVEKKPDVKKPVPPTPPPARKRLNSKSGKVPPAVPKKPPIPMATGPEVESVRWANELLAWLYMDYAVANELQAIWIQALNEGMKQSVAEHGVGVELIKILPETHPPSLTNIFCECASNDDVTITCDCEATPAMQLKAFRQRGEKVEVSHYRANVNKLRGRLNIFCITEKMQTEIKFDGWPEIKILLAQVGSLKNTNLDEQSLQDVIVEIVTMTLRNTSVSCNLSHYAGCPRLVRRAPTPTHHLPLHYDSMLTSSNSNLSKYGEKLSVKIVKATGLAVEGDNFEPYCVVEVDNPPQNNQTQSIRRSSDSPNWNEQFYFNVNLRTNEIMFEVYDKAKTDSEKNRFLGVAIVGVQELMESTSQRQVISLQSRPYQNDKVSGSLTLEFAFVDGNGILATNTKPVKEERAPARSAQTTAQHAKSAYANPLERDYLMNGNTDHLYNDVNSLDKTNSAPATNRNMLNTSPNPQKDELDKAPEPLQSKNYQQLHAAHQSQPNSPDTTQQNGNDISRGRKRGRDIFGTIRKRLNRSRGRAKSVERGALNGDAKNESPSRSVSADRARDHSVNSAHSTGYLSVGPLPREGSARSSLSEMSGVSGASSRTYLNEASTLILETVENGIKKHYLVPLSLAQKNKWKKKGIKLHIFNDHTFVAKHLPGGTICQICNRTLPRRLGKQGYQCRDCSLKCHKHCHIKTDTTCPTSTVQGLELSGYLKHPKFGDSR